MTGSGLIVTDRRVRSAHDPRDYPPNDNQPPVGSVGPNVAPGFGDTHVMYDGRLPPPVQAWQGWPVEWATPNWGEAVGLGEAAIRVSVVYGAIDLNASILSTMPPYMLTKGTAVQPVPWMLNPEPNVYTGWIEAFKQVVVSYLAQGEAFLWATSRYKDGPGGAPGSVRNWVMLDPAWVKIKMIGQVRRYWMAGVDITEDVLHLKYQSWPGTPHGIGPLEALASNLFGAAAMERYQAQLTTRGGIPWGVITVPGNMGQTQAIELRDNYVAARMSARGAPAVLTGGATLAPLYINPKDMALLELRQFDEARIATLLGVPPALLALPTGESSMTYQNKEGIYDFHWRSSLRPKAAYLSEAISQWALPHGSIMELNRDEYTRPPLGERLTAWQTAFNIYDPATGQRVMNVDEIRAAERFAIAGEPPPNGTDPSSVNPDPASA